MKTSAIRTWSIILLLLTISVAFILRLQISWVRYFDTDEWAHLHWAFHIFTGQIPYRDFFIYHIPLFQVLYLPLFLLPQAPESVQFSRIIMLFVFTANIVILSHIIWKTTKDRISVLLSILMMLIAPIMIDKGLEVRPDMLMVFFFLICMWITLLKPHNLRFLFTAGIALGLSLLTFQKMLFAFPALAVLFLYTPTITILKHKSFQSLRPKAWIAFIIGVIAPFLIFFSYLLFHGAVSPGLDSIFRVTKEMYSLEVIKFSPFLALTPWQYIYVSYEGPNLPWAVNTFILLAMIGGTILFAIDKKWKLFLFFSLFFLGAMLWLILFPSPYVQYYIPIIMIGSIPLAYFFRTVLKLFPQYYSLGIIIIICTIALLSYYEQYQERLSPQSNNREQMQVIRDVVAHIHPQETVYDMTGSYLYRPSGYVLCCHHRYADFVHLLKPAPPTLTESLIQRETKFIVLDRNGYAFWLVPEPHKTFIRSNYLESRFRKIYSIGYRYQCTQNTCKRINYEGGVINEDPTILPIVIEESYKIKTTPSGLSITVNGEKINDQETKTFSPGQYSLVIPEAVSEAIIQLDR